jgi:chemotaxis protein MotB
MAETSDNEELVIIRRRSAFVDSEYKSGVWKIAYADFMTAMMAFFLVMWLLNATNKETRESVASYFNPVKLAETTPDRKGVNDPKKAEPINSETEGEAGAPGGDGAAAASAPPPARPAAGERPSAVSEAAPPPRHDEASLFRDPYAILTDIAGGPASMAKRERRIGITLGPPDRQGAKGGEAYRDPFDPIYWQVAPQASIERRSSSVGDRGSLPVDEDLAALVDGEAKKPPEGRLDATVSTSGYQPDKPGQGAERADPAAAASVSTAAPPGAMTPESSAAPASSNMGGPAQARSETTRASEPVNRDASSGQRSSGAAETLQAAIRSIMESAPKPGPIVEVERTDEGLLVSLTDASDFGMFAIGSAEPQRELVHTIDKIAPLLANYAGAIVIRGHTDARPFRSQNYDNWRLSTARAHMAYYMLLRAGIEPNRIERIEGHADRKLKRINEPLAAPNRRIEILVMERRP